MHKEDCSSWQSDGSERNQPSVYEELQRLCEAEGRRRGAEVTHSLIHLNLISASYTDSRCGGAYLTVCSVMSARLISPVHSTLIKIV